MSKATNPQPEPEQRGSVVPDLKTRVSPCEPLLLNAKETARSLAISGRKLWELTNLKDIPSVRIGRRVLYDPNDLRAWVDKHKEGL